MPKKDPRAVACAKGYKRALTAAKKEYRREQRVLEVQRQAFLKEEAKWHSVREAEGKLVQLPAIVLRDGTVKSVDVGTAVTILGAYADEMCLDVETSGYWIGHNLYELRTIQLGGEEVAVVLDADDPEQREVVRAGLRIAKVLHAHSAMADVIPCVHAGLISWDDAWGKMIDSVLIAKLNDPKMSGSDANGLKDLAHDMLKEYATSPAAEKEKNELFKAMGCKINLDAYDSKEVNGWYNVNRFSETMIRYAGSDVLDLAAVLRVMPPIPVDDSVLQRERVLQEQCAEVAWKGFKLDKAHIKKKIAEHEAAKSGHLANILLLSDGRIPNPSASQGKKAVGIVLADMFPEIKPKLAVSETSGNPSADKKSLSSITKDDGLLVYHLSEEILAYRHDVTTLGLLLRPLEDLCDNGDGRMRPIVFTINAATGRMSCVRPNGQQFCYTSSMDILTDQGWKPFPKVDGSERVAQWSDGLIEFVTPEAVLHQEYDGPMIKISGEHHEQIVTPNHRVYSTTRDGKLMVEDAESWLKHGSRDKIVDRKFIRGGRLVGRNLTDQERLALYRAVAVQADGHFRDDCNFVSIKLTKPRKIERARELHMVVRETPNLSGGKKVFEAKSYEEDCAPWLDGASKTFNIPALLELSSEDLAGFLHEVMIWDGDSTRLREYRQHETRKGAVDAVELAAILSGNSTTRSVYTLNGRNYENVGVFHKSERFASCTNVEEVPSDGWIHCVTVPSGAIVVRSNGKVIVSGNSRQGEVRKCVVADEYTGIGSEFFE